MDRRRVALLRALPILIGIVVFGAIILFLALRTMQGIEQSEAVAERFAGLAQVCQALGSTDGVPAEQESAGIVDDVVNLRGVAFRLVEGEWIYDISTLPVEWRAAQPEEAQVVLCLGPSEPLVAAACGADEDGDVPTRVYGEALTVRLAAANTGVLLAEDVLLSAPEIGCREEVGPVLRVDAGVIERWVAEEIGD